MNSQQLHKSALAHFKEKQLEKALQLFNQAIQMEQHDPDLFHDRGVCLFHLSKKKEALADMNTALSLQPDYSYRYSSRAYMKGQLKDLQGAIADYRKAIELDPEDAIAHNNLGLLEEQLGYQESAKKHFSKADELSDILKENGIDPATLGNEEPVNLQKQIDEEKAKNSSNQAIIREMLSVFQSREKFKEFMSFMSKGFKSK